MLKQSFIMPGAIFSIVLWVILAFITQLPTGWVNLPLAVGVVLIAVRIATGKPS
ncbi:MAG: hypothetical protein ACE5HT_01125 [Gemmatimonadales bacterium]